ncbi:polyphenol oxidase family protein [Massilia niabensis]|uniref:Polyphenol oxidase family protein n=1 Tax=Massilia niabensis TaxID=544910 RepID=A0ABW0L670_9BURK
MIENMLTSSLLDLPTIVHGFGTRCDNMASLMPDYWRRRPVQHERHGTRVAVVTEPNEDCGEADGMLTDRPGLLLTIATADCVPVLLAHNNGSEVAALHVGWRGAQAGIVDAFAALVRARGGDPSDWIAATGAAAQACCYEVGPEVIDGFVERHGLPREFVAPRDRMLDLPAIVQWQLQRAGIGQVARRTECTLCHCRDDDGDPTFHSYRRDHATRIPVVDVQWSVIALVKRSRRKGLEPHDAGHWGKR